MPMQVDKKVNVNYNYHIHMMKRFLLWPVPFMQGECRKFTEGLLIRPAGDAATISGKAAVHINTAAQLTVCNIPIHGLKAPLRVSCSIVHFLLWNTSTGH